MFLVMGSCNSSKNPEIISIEQYRELRLEKLNQPRVIHNNDGCDVSQYPVNSYTDKEFSISSFLNSRSVGLKGSDVTTISYCSISSSFGQFSHHTKVGEFLTKPYELKPGRRNVVPEFVKLRTDPLEVTCKFAHENGFEFFWSNRINDCHDHAHRLDKPYPKWSKLKTEHPEYLFGAIGEKLPHGRWSAVDFSHQEIRDLCVKYYTEVCENYDVDGVELDFFRSLALLFRDVARGEYATQEQLDMLTDMLTQIKKMTERVGMEKGNPILILARLPDGIEYCRGMGVDLQKWMSEGLVDIVVGGGLFRLNPWTYLVEQGHQYGVKVYAGLSESRVKQEHHLLARRGNPCYRARSAAAWQAGVDGLYIFNEYNTRKQYLSEIGNADKLKTKNNLYFVSYLNWNPESPMGSIKNGKKYSNLPLLTPVDPVKLNATPATFPLEIGDESTPAEVALILYSEGGNPESIRVSLNDTGLKYLKNTESGLSIFKVPNKVVVPGMNDITFHYNEKGREMALFDAALFFYRDSTDQDIKELANICFTHDKGAKEVIDTIRNAVLIRQPINDLTFKNRLFQQVPSIAATEDGEQLFVAWYSGGENEGAGNYITLSVSLDHGESWQKDQLIVSPKDNTTRFFDPAIWRDNSGIIHLYYASSENPQQLERYKLYDLKAGVNEMDIAWDGNKIVYEAPRRISNGIMMNKPVYVEEIKSALFPVALWRPWFDGYKDDPNYIGDGVFIYRRDYKEPAPDGKLSPYSSIEINPDNIRKVDEHMVAKVSDEGELLCLVRTKGDNGIHYSRSHDFGKTWSNPQLFSATGPTTSSRFYISKLHSGKILLIMNDSKTRTNMTAFLSEDGGYTWPHKLLLDDRERVSYPDADQTNDGNIHVVFDHDRFGTGEILYCRFTEEDIIAGKQDRILKKRLSPPNIKPQGE